MLNKLVIILLIIIQMGFSQSNNRDVHKSKKYTITQMPNRDEFQDLKAVVTLLDSQMPVTVKKQISQFSGEELENGIAISYTDTITEYNTNVKMLHKPMIVEYSVMVMDISLGEFNRIIPAEKWGQYLSGWKGGEIKEVNDVTLKNSKYQTERMVLGLGNDMTKAEIIEKSDSKISVFWRVYFSDNGSTLSDVGKLDIISIDKNKIKIIFHSAHDLKFYGLLRLPKSIIQKGLKQTFLKHLKQYKKVVEADLIG